MNFINPCIIKRIVLIVIIAAICQLCRFSPVITAQDLVTADKTYNERIFALRVKQLNEFFKRFNYEKDFSDNDINYFFSSRISRADYIRLLFDEEDERLDTENTGEYVNLVESFIREVEDSSYRINKYSDKIFAEINCVITLDNKKSVIQLVLNQEVSTGLKWTICGINNDFIEELLVSYRQPDSILSGENDSSGYIPPYSNETNFIVLKNLLDTGNKNIYSLNSEFHNKERNRIFYYLIYNGSIEFHHVSKITYYILDIPGWCIKINNFIRNTENSGWLISDLRKTDSQVNNYFKEKYSTAIAD